jgi:hypothetical protein
MPVDEIFALLHSKNLKKLSEACLISIQKQEKSYV